MTVEVATNPQQLNTAWPLSADMVSEGDDHIRVVKTVIKTTFPNFGGAFNATHTEANYLVGVTSGIQGQLNGKGAIAGQTWAGTHVFPSTTTIGGLTPTIRGYLETVTSDAQAQINARAIKAGDTYTGTHNFTGAVINVPTAAAGNSSNQAASTAFVMSAAFSSALPAQAGQTGKYVKTDGTAASWEFVTWSDVTGKPTTVSGYAISDAVTLTGTQTLQNKTYQGVRETMVTANTGTAYTINIASGTIFDLTLTGNCTYTFPTATSGNQFTLLQRQDATGSRTVTWPASVRWAGGTAPTITATAGRTDVISFVADGTYWIGFVGGLNYTRA